MTVSSSLEAGRVPAAHAAADLTWTPWKSTTLTPTPGARLRRCQTSAQTWPPSRTEARYTSLGGVAIRALRERLTCTTRRRTPGRRDSRLCRPRAPALSQATRVTTHMPLAEQMGFRHRMQTRCTMSPTTPGPTRPGLRLGRRLVSVPTAAGYALSAAPRLHMAF